MKLQIISDIHLEFSPAFVLRQTDADVIIIAGDLHVGVKGLHWIKDVLPSDKPIIYVIGNHEYYKHSYPLADKMRQEIYKLGLANVFLLENAGVRLPDNKTDKSSDKSSNDKSNRHSELGVGVSGSIALDSVDPTALTEPILTEFVEFFGCTLWTDFELDGDGAEARLLAQYRMNDCRRIRNANKNYSQLIPLDTVAIHKESVAWLRQSIAAASGAGSRKIVVITHHAPSRRSILAREREDGLNPAYASNLEDLVASLGDSVPCAVWIHGHVHHSLSYKVGKTLVLANPKGYPDDPNYEFDPGLTIEI